MAQLDRAELTSLMDRYLDALGGHAPNRLPLAGTARYSENGQKLDFGDGLWGTATKIGKYRIVIPDVAGQQVGYIGVVYQNTNPCCFSTRLRVEDGAITEIETLVAQPALMRGGAQLNGAAELEKTGTPHPVFSEKLAPADRVSRAQMIEAANAYFSGLERNSGYYPTPFTEDCNRLENGMQTTNVKPSGPVAEAYRNTGPNLIAMSPDAQFKSGYFKIVTAIRNRRFPVVDEETGNVLAFGFFDHNGTVDKYKLTTGEEITSGLRNPFTWMIAELFKVQGGKLRQIEAVLEGVPYGMKNAVWDN